jgi:hypothetical protein
MPEMTDSEFLTAFETKTLPRPLWTHAAHLRMAYLYLNVASYADALPRICDGIRAYNAAQGNFTGYNETVTVAFARLVAGRLNERPALTFADFERENADLFADGLHVLLRWYSYPVWKNPASREQFLEPDKEPLPIPVSRLER